MASEPQPNKRMKSCLIGCGVVALLGLLGLVALISYAWKSSNATLETANTFVQTVLAGDDTAAYDMLYEAQRQKTSPKLFTEHWDAARKVVGASPAPVITGKPAPNFESGLVTLQYTVTGGLGTVMVEVDVNPGEKPPTVVNYRITGVPTATTAEPNSEPGDGP